MKTACFSVTKIIALFVALVLALMLLFFGMQQKTFLEKNIVFVLDLSYSMNAQDIDGQTEKKISRLDAAKEIIEQVVHAGGETHYGLVVFSEAAHRLVPLTADTGTFLEYIKDVNTGLLPGGGTDWNSLEKIFSGNVTKYTKIIFISDVEMGSIVPNWQTFKGSHAYFIAIGTKEGEYPRLPNGIIMKAKGEKIISRFDEQVAVIMSKALNAKLFHVERIDGQGDLVSDLVHRLEVFSYPQAQIPAKLDRGLIVLLGVFILLVL